MSTGTNERGADTSKTVVLTAAVSHGVWGLLAFFLLAACSVAYGTGGASRLGGLVGIVLITLITLLLAKRSTVGARVQGSILLVLWAAAIVLHEPGPSPLSAFTTPVDLFRFSADVPAILVLGLSALLVGGHSARRRTVAVT
ncbi:hypothetical protein ACO0LV_15265 [Pseudactinotalea sp. Z1739]|uniref:hypothetical protein n=1 Tax=Pseudactinotalea sp. Z1739 TaxID=3413028 RepID=UPI003C7B8968